VQVTWPYECSKGAWANEGAEPLNGSLHARLAQLRTQAQSEAAARASSTSSLRGL
jgi:hypothetical protein